MLKKYIPLLLLAFSSVVFSQENEKSSDELFIEARNLAFENKDYSKAIQLTEKALEQSPNYTDIAVFLGRLYTWNDQVDKARDVFKNIDQTMDKTKDFYQAYTSLEYWNDNYAEALRIVDNAIMTYPNDEELLLLKAKILNSDKQYDDAEKTINQILGLNKTNTEARELATRISTNNTKNAIGVSYTFTHFDKQFEDNWHQTSLSYKRQTGIGSVIFKVNYANKFKTDALQYEVEAYPRLSKTFYMYVGAGISGSDGVFPKYRTGASLYANLPKSFEAELGFRQLHFSDDVWMFTGSVGKYYKNFWFNLRTFITPSNDNISHSYTLTTRYYTGGANDYLSFAIGSGISPEDYNNVLLGTTTYKLKTFKLGLDYNFSVKELNNFSVGLNYFNQEFRPNQKGNQFDFNVSYSRKF